MAFSIQRAVSDGTMTLLPISIEYFDREEISVLFDGVLNARQWAWVGTTDSTLSFTPAVANTVEVMIVRSTDLAELRHQFSLGAQFTAESLDESLLQILHIAQEAKEGSNLGEIFQNLNFHGFKAINMGNGSDPGDAVNHAQMEVHDTTIVGYMGQAESFKNAAAASAAAASAAKDALFNDLSSTSAGKGAELVGFVQSGTGAVATDVQRKLRESVSVKDFGAVADGTSGAAGTDNLLFFKAAIDYLESQGGGSLYVPSSDGIYDVSSPIIVGSNIEIFGDGASSKIRNSVGTYTNAGDVVHIGTSSEWVGWNNSGAPVTDASIAQFDAGDYSKLTTKNAAVRNIHVMTKAASGAQGLGIWVVNATNFVVENIWSSNTATPINVANDSLAAPMACRNGVVKNVFQVTSGRWYDLAYIGDAEFIDVSGCFNNPTDNSTLNAAITVGGLGRFNKIHDNQIRFQTPGTKIGIELTGPSPATNTANIVEDNLIVTSGTGIVVYQMNNQIIRGNTLYDCTTGITLYNTGHTLDSNVFVAGTTQIYYKSGCSGVDHRNMNLDFSKLGEQAAGLINQQTFDYRAGNWTPTYAATGSGFTTLTMDVVSATYVRVGKQVTVRAFFRTDNVNITGATGDLIVSGLPFASAGSDAGWSPVEIGYANGWASNTPIYGRISSNQNYFFLVQRSSIGGSDTPCVFADMTTGANANKNEIIMSATYFVD